MDLGLECDFDVEVEVEAQAERVALALVTAALLLLRRAARNAAQCTRRAVDKPARCVLHIADWEAVERATAALLLLLLRLRLLPAASARGGDLFGGLFTIRLVRLPRLALGLGLGGAALGGHCGGRLWCGCGLV